MASVVGSRVESVRNSPSLPY